MRFFQHQATAAHGDIHAAAQALLSGEVHRLAGVAMTRSGTHVTVHIGPIHAPCEIIHWEETDTRAKMTYRALPGHPEAGEESFLIERCEGKIIAHVFSLSEGAAWYTRNPIARWAQRVMAKRYARALVHCAQLHQ